MPVRAPETPSGGGLRARGALRARLVGELRERIRDGTLPHGAALPSVRALARERGISAFTAAEVYNVLVAAGLIEARRGRGYFVAGAPPAGLAPARAAATADALWERRLEARPQPILVDAGGGWLPAGWQYGEGIRAALRAQARLPLSAHGYGSPFGLEALRSHFAMQLRARGLAIADDSLVLTQGATQALDLIVRTLLEPGDAVAVEDPGYPPTLELLRARGVRLVAVPRLASGPDVAILERLARRRAPATVRALAGSPDPRPPRPRPAQAACARSGRAPGSRPGSNSKRACMLNQLRKARPIFHCRSAGFHSPILVRLLG